MKHNIGLELLEMDYHLANTPKAPSEPVIIDNQPHRYEVCIDGKSRKGIYTATSYPLDRDPTGPALACSYGLIDEKEQYNYSSLKK